MGMTRRLNHYDNPAWQPFLIVAACGAVIILCGIVLQILQLIVSVAQREQTRDLTGDPWNGRTLEWSIPSPPPFYNFSRIPVVRDRDAFWEMKDRGIIAQAGGYGRIHMPRNTAAGFIIGGFGLVLGFALVWHIWWMAALGLAGMLATAIVHSFDDDRDYYVAPEEVARIESRRAHFSMQGA
jgi:cytochrome o ubiquinol oxidase subunit 1